MDGPAAWPIFTALALRRLAASVAVLAIALAVRWVVRWLGERPGARPSARAIWVRKFINLSLGALAALAILSIWFPRSGQLAVFSGLLAGGIAFASQNVLLSVAGFFVIVFGRVFRLGDRVEFGGIRGDVLDIGLIKTTIMEMGVPADLLPNPNHWVAARQYTGRVVTVANSEVFRSAAFNYSRTFNFIWEELRIPLRYNVDLQRAEQIILDAARTETASTVARARSQLSEIKRHFLIGEAELGPRVYVQLTDNWIELAVRFITPTHEIRELKDRMSRAILEGFREAGIEVASSTSEIVHLPPLELKQAGSLPRDAGLSDKLDS